MFWFLLTVYFIIELIEIVYICFSSFFFFFKYLFIYFWLCWVFVSLWGLSLVVASGGHSSSQCAGLSLSRPLLLRSTGSRHTGSVIVAHGPSCSAACGIFPDQGSNLCPLHWQADSQPLRHQGSPASRAFALQITLEKSTSSPSNISGVVLGIKVSNSKHKQNSPLFLPYIFSLPSAVVIILISLVCFFIK